MTKDQLFQKNGDDPLVCTAAASRKLVKYKLALVEINEHLLFGLFSLQSHKYSQFYMTVTIFM